MRPGIMFLVLGLAACTTTARGTPPVLTVTLDTGLDAAAACLVRQLNKNEATLAKPKLTHQIQTIEPGKIYEILPQQYLGAGEWYYVRLAAVSDHQTEAQLFAIPAVIGDKPMLIAGCKNPAPTQ